MLTLSTAIRSWKFTKKRRLVARVHPVFVNAFGVSAYVSLFYSVPYWASVATITIGEFVAAILVGYPLLIAVEKATRGSKPKEIKSRT